MWAKRCRLSKQFNILPDFTGIAIMYSKFAAFGKVQAKKNLGLMQMQYRDMYVAKVFLQK